jgi:ATP-dependent DNA helicase RecG
MEQFIREQIGVHGAQVYWVVPRVEKGEDEDVELKDLRSTYEHLTRDVLPGTAAGFLYGGSSAAEKESVLRQFAGGTLTLLVATTVVEVGVDAPGATVMVVENAERFGLSELHQLRGRVGRGERESYCFVLSPAVADSPAGRRLSSFCSEHDGFALAELDLKTRGPGEIAGQRQSGWDDRRMGCVLENLGAFMEVQEYVARLLGQA